MAASDNMIQITGTLGKAPDLKYIASGRAVVSFTVATNRRWKDRSDEWKEETVWHNVTAWGELGENAAASLDKGNRVMVAGRLSTRSYEDREGNTKYVTEIIADSIGAELRFATCQIERTERTKPTNQSAKPDTEEEPF
jgi:single-strand DNA-binding protein